MKISKRKEFRDEDYIKAIEIWESYETDGYEHDEEFKGCLKRLLEKENYFALGRLLGSQVMGY